jgi:hypothetical protein
MNKIKKAQQLADDMLDECNCQVGDDKGALKDKPETVVKSFSDIKKAVSMEGEDSQITKMVNNIATYLGEDFKEFVETEIQEADQVATAQQKDTLFDKLGRVVKKSDKLKPSITREPTTEASAKVNAIRLGIARNDKNYEEGNDMDPKAKANAKKRKEDKVSEGNTLSKLQAWGKNFMMKKKKQGLKVTEKRDKALKKAVKA